jgi:hypothetical protein
MRQDFITKHPNHPQPQYYNESKTPDENIIELKKLFDLAEKKKVAVSDDYTKNNQFLQSSVKTAVQLRVVTAVSNLSEFRQKYPLSQDPWLRKGMIPNNRIMLEELEKELNDAIAAQYPTLNNPECNKSIKLGPDNGNLKWVDTTGECYWENIDKVGDSYYSKKYDTNSRALEADAVKRYGLKNVKLDSIWDGLYAPCAPGYYPSSAGPTEVVCTRKRFGLTGFKKPKDYPVVVSSPVGYDKVDNTKALIINQLHIGVENY